MKRFIKYWLPVALWAGFIFFVSSIPGSGIPALFACQDILFHIFEYALLGLLLSRALKNSRFGFSGNAAGLFLAILVSLLYAVSDEFHQSFVPGRESSLFDVLADGLGIVLGAVIYRRGVYR
ncbi:MAG: VanZ family protein [Candidatus Omnitrophota bacterium]